METNFEFLNKNFDTQKYYQWAWQAEQLYIDGYFSDEIRRLRVIAENITKDILDLKFVPVRDHDTFNDNLRQIKNGKYTKDTVIQKLYEIKGMGNEHAHEMTRASKKDGLEALKDIFYILVYFSNTFYDTKISDNDFKEPLKDTTYSTSERKLIYIQTVDQKRAPIPMYKELEKIGDTSIDDMEADLHPNSDDLNKAAKTRIKQYMTTAGLPYVLQWTELAYRKSDKTWFRDHDIHEVLERSGFKANDIAGNEWFRVDLETAKRAIAAYKAGYNSLQPEKGKESEPLMIHLRPEQRQAIDDTKKAFKKHNKMLWNAKMRFGKTLTALFLIKEQAYKRVLIMTHRPVVNDGWFEDFRKSGLEEAGYLYGSRTRGEQSVSSLEKLKKPYIYFASIQDLRGSTEVGGKVSDKNHDIFSIPWDIVIIDEAHEGTQTDLAQNVQKTVLNNKKDTKLLELSGTPFNILDDYDSDQIFTWDYVMEQKAKMAFTEEHPDELNPYDGLPAMSMYTFEMSKHFKENVFFDEFGGNASFNFKEFFRTNKDGKFQYEFYVRQFLQNITTPGKTNYPFSTPEFRNNLRHTLWILPGIKECNALEDLLNEDNPHNVFKQEGYKIVNVVRGDSSAYEEGTQSDKDKIMKAMEPDPAQTKTITLTVRKMTTGVTIRPWTGVLFLSNTNSSMQYLQAAFRGQTPYSSETFGKKTHCYVFDFAPDRALTVIAEASKISTGAGKIQTHEQRENMRELLNFLPVVGEQGNSMKPFAIDDLLQKVKQVYAEKAVRSGFDDDSIYSDELLKMKSDADLELFTELQKIVGRTKKEKPSNKVSVNSNGLSEEEYKKATRGAKKNKKDRTPEEQAALDKMKEMKKKKQIFISILRGVSIRIPMMIYGMDIEFDKDVTVQGFMNRVDDISWEEFMPKGVTKDLFKKMIKYYDADIFIKAGKIIRSQVKRLDDADPLDRIQTIATIFSSFKNPDKETVLTPWRVVNMHLGKTIGGLSYYDDTYENTFENGHSAEHWIQTEYTDKIYNPDTHILEINSKTGLYPLYVVSSMYYQAFKKLNEETGGKFSLWDEQILWKKILRENIFLVAKTPMAKEISTRTLCGYHKDWSINIEYIGNIIEDSRRNIKEEARKIRRLFGNMKFDVVIGNPPYQQSAKGDTTRQEPIYHLFMDLSYQLSDLVTLITPARFLAEAGNTPKKWNKKMLQDDHLKVVMFEKNSDNIFPHTDIKGGVVITLRDATYSFGAIKKFIPNKILNSIFKKVHKQQDDSSFADIVSAQGLCRFTNDALDKYPEVLEINGKGTKNKITSKVFSNAQLAFKSERKNDTDVKMLGLISGGNRAYKYLNKNYLEDNIFLNSYKVLIAESNGSGKFGESLSSPIIAIPGTGHTDTFLSIGPLDTLKEATSVYKYIKTKFTRSMLGTLKVTQHNPKSTWQNVPLQDFTSKSDIDWTKSISDIDQQLYKKYHLTDEEIAFIEEKVQPMP